MELNKNEYPALAAELAKRGPRDGDEVVFDYETARDMFDQRDIARRPRDIFCMGDRSAAYVTPLDPTHVFVTRQRLEFPAFMVQTMIRDQQGFMGKDMSERVAPAVVETITDELVVGGGFRCAHNEAAMKRLLEVMQFRPPSHETYQSIQRARGGEALPHEITRIIKEYPEMISAELHRTIVALDKDVRDRVVAKMDEDLMRLAEHSPWSDVEVYPRHEREQTSFSIDDRGLVVSKHRVASARSIDSDVEVIRTEVGIAVLRDNEGNIIKSGLPSRNERYDMLPIAVSEYVRTADYRERRAIQPLDVQHDDLITRFMNTEFTVDEQPFFEGRDRDAIAKQWSAYVKECTPETRHLLLLD